MRKATPSEVLFDVLKGDLGINNRDAARILLSDRPAGSKPAPRLRVTEKTFLSRYVVHVNPATAKIDRAMFADFSQSVQNLMAAARLDADEMGAVFDMGRGERGRCISERMIETLDSWELAGSILRNTLDRVTVMPGLRASDRRLLQLMALTVCGCLADPHEAAAEVERFAESRLAVTFGTLDAGTYAAHERAVADPASEPVALGLLRIAEDGSALPPIYRLDTSDGGTVIGSFAQDAHAITNVGPDVSHRHLRIEYSEGAWLASGLGSTNGTVLVGQDGSVTAIEPPRRKRAGTSGAHRTPIQAGDLLELGASTRFLVIRLGSEGPLPA